MSCRVLLKVEEETPLFLSVPDTDGDETADELCLSARHEAPFVAAPGTPLTLTYFLCTADDVKQVSGPIKNLRVYVHRSCLAWTYRPIADSLSFYVLMLF